MDRGLLYDYQSFTWGHNSMTNAHEAVIGLIGAMDEEIEWLLQAAQPIEQVDVAGLRYYKSTLHGKHIVICKSGVGKVNAAITTQVLIDRFHVTKVIFTGVAGAVDPELDIGDIVISTACMHHDMDATALGFAPGVIPFQETSQFVADSSLVGLAERICEQLVPNHYCKGIVLSGDQFVANREKVRQLHSTFVGSVCTEMEGAAVAQACFINGIPFVVIRSLSDKADGTANVNFAAFMVEAARRSYQIVNSMVKEIVL